MKSAYSNLDNSKLIKEILSILFNSQRTFSLIVAMIALLEKYSDM